MLKINQYPFITSKNELKTSDNKSTTFLLKGGFIRQEIAGVYNYLFLGKKILDKIEKIIKKHLDAIGSFEILMSSLGSREHWQTTNRHEMDVLFSIPFSDNSYHFLNPTHEEIVTPLMKEFINKGDSLPISVYQIQNKFRNEKRAKSGILRGREFIMKDMYSFHSSQYNLDCYYEIVTNAYKEIFKELGLGNDTFFTYASGGAFSRYSHEFQTALEIGEDVIYVDIEKGIAINQEIINDLGVKNEFSGCHFKEIKSCEIGNIFKLGTKFSAPFNVKFQDHSNNNSSGEVYMGCYGIGISRAMGIIAEKFMDNNGLCWPLSIAPYHIYIIVHGNVLNSLVIEVCNFFEHKGFEIILDDRDVNFGTKAHDADLLGIPYRISLSEKSLKNGVIEIKRRSDNKVKNYGDVFFTSNFDLIEWFNN